MSDAELVERARQGDREAFDELVGRYQSTLYRVALAALGSPAEAEDALQEALVAAWFGLERFRGEASVKTWLVTIAWHKALDRRRRLRARLRRFLGGDAPEPAAVGDGPGRALEGQQRLERVLALVGTLPRRLRAPLLLAASQEHAYEEIAALLGRPLGTVKTQVSEARRLLKERLRED